MKQPLISFPSLVIAVSLLSAARLGATPVTYSFDDTAAMWNPGEAGTGTFVLDLPDVTGSSGDFTATGVSGGSGSITGSPWTSVVFHVPAPSYPSETVYPSMDIIGPHGDVWLYYDVDINGNTPLGAWEAMASGLGDARIFIRPVTNPSVPDDGSSMALLGGALFALAAARRLFR